MSTKLQEILDKVNGTQGKGTAMLLSGDNQIGYFDRIPTGSVGLDYITGGGYPKGRVIELAGWESSGKSSCCLHAIAECQKTGGTCMFIDAEQAFDAYYAECLGVDLSKLILVQPESGEHALETARIAVDTGGLDLLIIDSVATLIPKAELEGEVGDNQMGLQARMMSKAMRMLSPALNKHNTAAIFVNQFREKLGVIFGNPTVTSGGNALKYYSSIRIELIGYNSKTETNKEGEKTAKKIRAKCIKNKTCPPFRECEYMIEFGKGIDSVGEVLDAAVQVGVVAKKGGHHSYGEIKLGNGATNVKNFLRDNLELLEEIKELTFNDHTEKSK